MASNDISTLEIEVDVRDSQVIVNLTGRLDTTTCRDFEEKLSIYTSGEYRTRSSNLLPLGMLILDFSGVTFVSSAGLRAVLVLARRAEEHDCVLRLAGLSEDVASILACIGFARVIPIHDDLAAALKDGD